MSIQALGGLQLPSQKEWAAGLGGLLAFGVIALASYLHYPLSDETETLLVVVLPPLIAKLVPPSEQDVLKHVNDGIVEAGVIAGKLTPPAQIVANDPLNTLMLQPAQLISTNTVPPIPPMAPQRMVDPAVRIVPSMSIEAARQLEIRDPLAHYQPPKDDGPTAA